MTPSDATEVILIPKSKVRQYLGRNDKPKVDLASTPEARVAIDKVLARYMPSCHGFFVAMPTEGYDDLGKLRKAIILMMVEFPIAEATP
jgi:hypothetical protein